jgi:hypothetical protein
VPPSGAPTPTGDSRRERSIGRPAGSRKHAVTSKRLARSNTITGYAEAPDRRLSLLNANGVRATSDSGPIDIAASPGGRQLLELNGLAGDLGVYAAAPDGTPTQTDKIGGLPAFNGKNGIERIAVT